MYSYLCNSAVFRLILLLNLLILLLRLHSKLLLPFLSRVCITAISSSIWLVLLFYLCFFFIFANLLEIVMSDVKENYTGWLLFLDYWNTFLFPRIAVILVSIHRGVFCSPFQKIFAYQCDTWPSLLNTPSIAICDISKIYQANLNHADVRNK